jgi:hypothetical protein
MKLSRHAVITTVATSPAGWKLTVKIPVGACAIAVHQATSTVCSFNRQTGVGCDAR